MGKKNKNKNQGFTLAEILITVAILASVFSIVSGLFFSAVQSQRRSLALQDLLKEVSYAMEYMSRQLRMAQKSDAGVPCTGPILKNYATTSNNIKFRSYQDTGECLEFSLIADRLKVIKDMGGPPPLLEDFLTSENIIVESFNVVVIGDDEEDPNTQPKITISLKARAKGEKQESRPEIQIQTTVSQRNLDI